MATKTHEEAKTLLSEGAASLGVRLGSERLEVLLDLAYRILKKNREINLTGAKNLPTLLTDHILDSLTLVPFLDAQSTPLAGVRPLLVDVGTGGGFPALPLAIVMDRLDYLCIESVAKKARVLKDLCKSLKLNHVAVINDRAEVVAHEPRWREQAAWATARGVGNLAAQCELTLPFLRVGGKFLAQKGPDVRDEVLDAQHALSVLGGRVGVAVSVGPERPSGRRTIVAIEKIARTPLDYPRRIGVPAKEPLRRPAE